MSLHILLVEDNALNSELVCALIEAEGHRVRVVGTGAAMRQVLKEGVCPSIILMDILLPDVDGTTLLRELRATANFATVPVIALTAQALAGDEERFLTAGFSVVVTKPIDTRTFMAVVERWASPSA